MSVCEKNGIKHQIKQYVSGGNDAANIQRSAHGVKVAVMSAPSRYIHSASNVIHKNDFESILFLHNLYINKITKYNNTKYPKIRFIFPNG